MPRLGVSINPSFDHRVRAPRPDAYGRRPRQISGVQIVGESAPALASLFLKATATLALIAILAMSLAIWRLFTFPH